MESIKNKLIDGYLSSGFPGDFPPFEVEDSYLIFLEKRAKEIIKNEGDWKLLHKYSTGETMFASKTLELGKKISVFFTKIGIQAGDIIHSVVGNENLVIPIALAAWRIGAITSNGDVNLEPHIISDQLKDTKAKLVFCTDETAELVKKAIDASQMKFKVFSLNETSEYENLIPILDNIDANNAPDPFIPKDPKLDMILIFWTSGSTGKPKGICHSHYSVLNFSGYVSKLFVSRDDVISTSCFFHVGGFLNSIGCLQKGSTHYHLWDKNRFKLEHIAEVITKFQCKSLSLGTHHYIQLAESKILEKIDPEDLKSLSSIFPSGTTVPKIYEDYYKKIFKNFKGTGNAFGQTESGIYIGGLSCDHFGLIFPPAQFKIVNPETNKICQPNETGEICIKGPGMMIGYLNRDKETQDYFDEEGFGHSGDLGYYTLDGNIYFVARMKEIIKSNGNHVSPSELEEILQSHPMVEDCLIYGKPDPVVQERICGVVVLKNNCKITEEELISFTNNNLTDYKKITGGIKFKNEIPRNSIGKLQRYFIRKWALEQ